MVLRLCREIESFNLDTHDASKTYSTINKNYLKNVFYLEDPLLQSTIILYK